MDHLRSVVQDQPGQRGKTLSLLKIQKKKNIWLETHFINGQFSREHFCAILNFASVR